MKNNDETIKAMEKGMIKDIMNKEPDIYSDKDLKVVYSNAKPRVKFGFNPYTQEFTCSFCKKLYTNDPQTKSLFLRLELFTKIMDFPICPKCSNKGLLETSVIIIKDNKSHPISLA